MTSVLPRSEPPPLPAWPANVFDHEPAHGFFQRLAHQNGQISTRTLATSMGLNGRNIDQAEMLEFCQRFPVRGLDKLAAATPIIKGPLVILSGETFSKSRDWSLLAPRICRGCIGDSPYYRNWFDLTVIGRCPLHDLPLEQGAEGMSLRWWFPEVGVTPNGFQMAEFNARRAETLPESWERYVLGRMGVLEPLAIPALDRSRMIDVIAVAKLLGQVIPFGWREAGANLPERPQLIRREAIIQGFEFLRGGPAAISDALERYLHSRCGRDESGDMGGRGNVGGGGRIFWGCLAEAEWALPPCNLTDMVRDQLRQVETKHNRLGLTSEIMRNFQTGVSLLYCSKKLNISMDRLKSVLYSFGVIEKNTDRTRRYKLNFETVSSIVAAAGELISAREAAKTLGTSYRHFMQIVDAGKLVPFAQVGSGRLRHNRFRRGDLARYQECFVTHGRRRGTPIETLDSRSPAHGVSRGYVAGDQIAV